MAKSSKTKQTQRSRWAALGFAACINLYAIALSALWTPLNSILLPDLVGESAPEGLRGSALGLITFVGIGAAVLLQPVAGAISDTSRLKDRRKPFIIPSSVVMVIALFVLAFLPGFWWLLLTYVVFQLAGNVAQAAFQELVPDRTPRPTGWPVIHVYITEQLVRKEHCGIRRLEQTSVDLPQCFSRR